MSNSKIADARGFSASRFISPEQVIKDGRMSAEEKRAFLARWASDAHAVISRPTMRHLPGTPFPIALSSILAAIAKLDAAEQGNDDDPPPAPAALPLDSLRPWLTEAA